VIFVIVQYALKLNVCILVFLFRLLGLQPDLYTSRLNCICGTQAVSQCAVNRVDNSDQLSADVLVVIIIIFEHKVIVILIFIYF